MDPVSLVAGALAAGLSGTVTAAAQDAYEELRDLLVRRLSRNGREKASAEQQVQALEALAANGASDGETLRAAVTTAGVATDQDVLAGATRVLARADLASTRVGKYVNDLHDAKGVQIGDNSIMNIEFR
ncbi:hypothetical protein ACIOBK_02090 [Micromonospora chokoriensis]